MKLRKNASLISVAGQAQQRAAVLKRAWLSRSEHYETCAMSEKTEARARANQAYAHWRDVQTLADHLKRLTQ